MKQHSGSRFALSRFLTMAFRIFFIFGAFLSLSGCTLLTDSLAEPPGLSEVTPSRQVVAEVYEVTAQVTWNQTSIYRYGYKRPMAMSIWTSNGTPIDYLLFYYPVEDGETLVANPGKTDTFHPVFYQGRKKGRYLGYASEMDAAQVRDLFVSTLDASGLKDVEASAARDFDFGGTPGKQIDISFRRDGGAEVKGRIVWTQHDGRLYAIVFAALAVHYHDRLSGPVERLLASLKFNPKAS